MLVEFIVGWMPKYALVGSDNPPSIAFVRSGIDGNKNEAVRLVVSVGVAKKVFEALVSKPSGLVTSGCIALDPVANVVSPVPPVEGSPAVGAEPESKV